MTIRMSADTHEYAGRVYGPGEEIDVQPQDVALLVALRRIERTEDDPIPGFMTREMLATPAPVAVTTSKPKFGKHNRKAA
ncbi:hypothetical protein ACHMW6_06375 [Pseudoduganella sp. UC29_106]|uniref:DUF7210 family protein n=1 Tax=Pseudoduganella sp. UC29_106 TaxID=3374553 RepID=UPI00375637BB